MGAATKSFNGNKPQNFINRFNYEFNKNSHNSSLIAGSEDGEDHGTNTNPLKVALHYIIMEA